MNKTHFHHHEMGRPIRIRSDYLTEDNGRSYGENIYNFQGVPKEKSIINVIRVKPGVALLISHFHSESQVKIDFHLGNAPVHFAYCLKGASLYHMHGLSKSGKETVTRPGTMNTSYIPNVSGEFLVFPKEDLLMVGLQIDPELFMEMVESQRDNLPSLPKELAAINRWNRCTYNSGMTPAMHSVARQIIHCPYKGMIRDLYYESKALELLSLQFEKLIKENGKPDNLTKMSRGDTERIHAARQILVSNMKQPPTLARLARKAGLNELKLKTGFKEIFGTTVFGFFRSYRMEKAKTLLESGELNVNETAWEVGYNNVSHFIAAFRKQHGMNPGEILK